MVDNWQNLSMRGVATKSRLICRCVFKVRQPPIQEVNRNPGSKKDNTNPLPRSPPAQECPQEGNQKRTDGNVWIELVILYGPLELPVPATQRHPAISLVADEQEKQKNHSNAGCSVHAPSWSTQSMSALMQPAISRARVKPLILAKPPFR